MKTYALFGLAALCEIGGCFAFWAWLKLGKSPMWLMPGVFLLVAFAYLLALVESPAAGRVYATYGGIYIVASLIWLRMFEGFQPDRWDMIGAAIALSGAAVIIAAPR